LCQSFPVHAKARRDYPQNEIEKREEKTEREDGTASFAPSSKPRNAYFAFIGELHLCMTTVRNKSRPRQTLVFELNRPKNI
jgi:hypothetical protein